MLVVVGGMILLPVVLVLGIVKGVHWYINRPTPTDQLYAQAQQRSITANFPEPEKFIEAYIDRFLDAIRDDLPAYYVYLAMVHIADALYKEENLNNPLPPIVAANTIEEGRYRDQLIAHQRKTADAPHTLEVFNATLRQVLSRFHRCAAGDRQGDAGGICQMRRGANRSPPSRCSTCCRMTGEAGLVPDAPLFSRGRGTTRPVRRHAQAARPQFPPGVGGRLPGAEPQADYAGPSTRARRARSCPPISPIRRSKRYFTAPIPFSFTDQQRYEHMHVVGGSGHGKTQLSAAAHPRRSARASEPPALDHHRQPGRDAAQDSAARPVRARAAAVRPPHHHRSRGCGIFRPRSTCST